MFYILKSKVHLQGKQNSPHALANGNKLFQLEFAKFVFVSTDGNKL